VRPTGKDSFGVRKSLTAAGKSYDYFDLKLAAEKLGADFSRLPYSLKLLLENLLRFEDGVSVTQDDVRAFGAWLKDKTSTREIAYRPARVLMQDFTGVPAVVDLAAMREAMAKRGGNAELINPLSPVDLVIDHSVMVDHYATPTAFDENVELEMQRNGERYEFLRWGQNAFNNFRVVPPGTGICHQVNLEYLAQVVWTDADQNGKNVAFPDTLVGTDSHTTMVNGLGVLGWGVGGIEAEAAMLGQPVSMLIPEVIGFRIKGSLREGCTATDLVLTVTQMLRKRGVVGKFVEFFGPGLANMPLADRATIGNMAPEYGATCGIFPVDEETLNYLRLSGRDEDRIALVEAYAKAQGMWRDDSVEPFFTDTLELNLGDVEPSLAGPKRPQDRVSLTSASAAFDDAWPSLNKGTTPRDAEVAVNKQDYNLRHGDVVIAAITSCTNTSNPYVMMAAGIVAQKANALGLTRKPWVKSSLAPGSKVVSEYLEKAGLQVELDKLGFNLVGYGCTTCIGNSGPLLDEIEASVKDNDLVVASVLSGNRNFEGRVHPLVRANYLASPPLVVAYALAGTFNIDITSDPLGYGSNGQPVFLKDIWPTSKEVSDTVAKCVTRQMFQEKYADVFSGDQHWQSIKTSEGKTYGWNAKSTYVQHPPFFASSESSLNDIQGANILGIFGDSITTDHISPAGNISKVSPAARYLSENGVEPADYNSYGSRRGNHEVMMRGTFANIRIRNEMLDGVEGGLTKYIPTGEQMSIYDAAMRYEAEATPLVIVAGQEYGTGSSRDWAAKGTRLLGVRAVIAESFERIHRSNLVGMGVIPLTFKEGTNRQTLGLKGDEVLSISGISTVQPRGTVTLTIQRADGSSEQVPLTCRIDTADEMKYVIAGGILHYVLGELAQKKAAA
jgi:aconitate hydratase